MRLEQITESDIRDTLQRAQEIAQQPPALSDGQYESFLRAAEEVGIPREATLQALRERRFIPDYPLTPGEPVFAPSEDGSLYPAVVLSIEGASASVRFLAGGIQVFAPGDLAPAGLTPGRKVQYRQRGTGWMPGRVCRYDPATQTVWLTSLWDQHEKKVALARLRLLPPKKALTSGTATLSFKVGLTCGAGGMILGLLLDYLLRFVLRVL